MKKISILALIISILIPLAVGVVSAALSARGMTVYGTMNKPPLSPPAWLFPVAWTILYVLMGIASYFVFAAEADGQRKTIALVLYGVQLFMNFMWSIIFFNKGAYLFAFIWLIIMLAIVVVCAFRFFGISPVAAYFMIPYIAWLAFASYLNAGACLLNMKMG